MTTDDRLGESIVPVGLESGLARSAGVLALGNAASRTLGLLREAVIAAYFGASGEVSAFRIASQVPVLLYDFLVGGMLSAALVPVLSDYARLRGHDGRIGSSFSQLTGALIGIFSSGLLVLVLLLELGAPRLAWLLAGGFGTTNPELLALTVRLIRLAAPAVWLFSMAGLVTAMLYALQRFSFPALATAVYNLGIVAAAPLLARRFGITSLVVGILAGSTAQLSLMALDLYRAGVRLHLQLDWRHPALWRITRLYLPIAAGLLVSLFQVGLDRRLASGTGEQSIAWMSNATTLQQMPLGLISVAISLAALPRLSQYYATGDEAAYRRTLGHGLRMVLLLVTPAAVLLWLLGEPLARVLFERHRFTPLDTLQVVHALNIYVLGMLFAAVDFPLNFAFYARNNTWLPALVGVLSVAIYIVFAFALVEPLGYLGLVWADSAKQASHALVMLGLLGWHVGRLHVRLREGVGLIAAAALAMAAATWGIDALLQGVIGPGLGGDLMLLLLAGGGGAVVYGGVRAVAGGGGDATTIGGLAQSPPAFRRVKLLADAVRRKQVGYT